MQCSGGKNKNGPINKSLLPAKPATTGLQGNPVVLLLYRKPQKSEIFGAASQDGGLLLTGGKGLFKGLLLTGGKGREGGREAEEEVSSQHLAPVPKTPKIGDFWGCFARWSLPPLLYIFKLLFIKKKLKIFTLLLLVLIYNASLV